MSSTRSSKRPSNWPLWIVVGVGSTALVLAGYLGALVQVGAVRSEPPRSIEHATAPVPPAKATLPAPQHTRVTAERAAVSPAATTSAAHSGATVRKAKTRDEIAKAASRATAELERELYGEQPPVLTTRPLPPTEPSEPSTAQPSREAVQQALLSMRPRLESCAAERHGTADAVVSVAGSGRATYALIRGDFAGTPEGSCMARALRAAAFPQFSGPVFKVQFPFVF